MKRPTNKRERILAKPKAACGTFPGMNRSRKFADRKHKANKAACRGRVTQDD